MSLRFEHCPSCGQSHAVYTCDLCKAEIIGLETAAFPFTVTVTAPGGASEARTHLCGGCVVELAKIGVSILPAGGGAS